LRQIAEAIPQTIVVLGPDESVVYVNRTVLDYTGLTSDEVMETDFREHGKVKCECVGRTASTVGF
jgi:PAS domain S-box-containing protein